MDSSRSISVDNYTWAHSTSNCLQLQFSSERKSLQISSVNSLQANSLSLSLSLIPDSRIAHWGVIISLITQTLQYTPDQLLMFFNSLGMKKDIINENHYPLP